ncbi:MAG: hypothetical protein A3A28_00090 [Candidatus Sungbacteria bacterium RIFCSPLOWO2_01_FULL_47_32]|uniref:VWFA domain-containing protein n=1 Tax=Candidatus Sungbacteria bacterium RIFCSPHIGHO2_01_FULL_47_32 TaxID=1802264 RepID=A0A1G2K9Y5_9BACT|nr:MAG: hypothetical protein UX72_C0001G0068 [Parcubacteria group bacterium GW2011_GWA2_47_10]OGZ95280.1 MAG: hypothetical protein A2633_06170 [Candidatus Sungbacteria bacterium RIFCSPHIGHO2_01_FULL_47_32]OGZ97984.1 MAG: hypothetical protein A3D57_02585 [Candidatus Sungbacteria bacterium RIFCSPHIGHO2_02_FULL_46_12]OHA06218.1 MAG: hypothetical protein A3A28_00090 [Candidatus Sungbacteria bacterium RIFCSPLOWO2_01_FULL_47_32]
MSAVSEPFYKLYQYFLSLLGADRISFRNTEVPFYFFSVGIFTFLLLGACLILFLSVRDMLRRKGNAHSLGMSFSLFWEVVGTSAAVSVFSLFLLGYSEPYSIAEGKRPVYKDEAVDFIFDLTQSQMARDIKVCDSKLETKGNREPCRNISRLEAVKSEAVYAVNKLTAEGVSYFCVGYFTTVFNRLVECTDSVETVLDMIERLDLSFAGDAGTNLEGAFGENYNFVKTILPKEARITAVVITDGGRETYRLGAISGEKSANGIFIERPPDWDEKKLEAIVREMNQNQSIRIIPVGVGSHEWVPVPNLGSDGREDFVKTDKGDILYTKLDENIIKKIALWSGDSERYFILREGKSFGDWLITQTLSGRRVDKYVPVEEYTEYWIYPVVLAVLLGSLYLGMLGFLGRLFAWLFRQES